MSSSTILVPIIRAFLRRDAPPTLELRERVPPEGDAVLVWGQQGSFRQDEQPATPELTSPSKSWNETKKPDEPGPETFTFTEKNRTTIDYLFETESGEFITIKKIRQIIFEGPKRMRQQFKQRKVPTQGHIISDIGADAYRPDDEPKQLYKFNFSGELPWMKATDETGGVEG